MGLHRKLITRLIENYLIGALIAVFCVGGILIFSTLSVPRADVLPILVTLSISLAVMVGAESAVFWKHYAPIYRALSPVHPSLQEIEEAYRQAHRFPKLSAFRILVPHWLGMLIPGVVISLAEIHFGILSLPYSYVGLAIAGSFLVASMHATVEFFFTTSTIRPVLSQLKALARRLYGNDPSVDGFVVVSVRLKFLLSVILIGAMPLLLFGLANRVRLSRISLSASTGNYWIWAGSIVVVGVAFAILGAWLLSRDVKLPIASLQSLMQRVEFGDFTVQAEDLYSDEFSILTAGFNRMVTGLFDRDRTNNQLLESYFATLAAALDARDPYTAGHSIRVADYAVEIGQRAGFGADVLSTLRKSALLHDIGKIGIRDDVLLKVGKLTDEEYEVIKLHPVIGESIIKQIQPNTEIQPLLPGIRSHHERYDGKGYPDGFKGEEIPLLGRILAVADAYDAMTSNRTYRAGMPSEKARDILLDGRGTQWDARFVDLFVEWLDTRI